MFATISVDKAQTVTVKLNDLSGRVLGASTQIIAAGTTLLSVPAAQKLSKGMYVVTVELEGGTYNYKVVK